MNHAEGALNILGCPCLPFDSEGMVKKKLKALVDLRYGGYSVAINAEKIVRRSRDVRLDDVIQGAALPVPDGAGAVLAMRWLHGQRSIKVDTPRCVLEAANEFGWRVFVLGSEESVNAAATSRIASLYPNIKVIGRLNGYADFGVIVEALTGSSPQVALLALGSPKQELLASELKDIIDGVLFIGCGGALDALAGKVRRAPKFFINNSLEWAYRLYMQPSRWRRQLVLPVFLMRLVFEVLRQRLWGLAGRAPIR